MRHYQMVLGIHGDLRVVAAGTTPARRHRHLRGQRLRRLLSVGCVKLARIARDTLLQLRTPPLHFRPCEVLVPVVHGLELAAIDGDARLREKTHLAAEFDEARAYLA